MVVLSMNIYMCLLQKVWRSSHWCRIKERLTIFVTQNQFCIGNICNLYTFCIEIPQCKSPKDFNVYCNTREGIAQVVALHGKYFIEYIIR